MLSSNRRHRTGHPDVRITVTPFVHYCFLVSLFKASGQLSSTISFTVIETRQAFSLGEVAVSCINPDLFEDCTMTRQNP